MPNGLEARSLRRTPREEGEQFPNVYPLYEALMKWRGVESYLTPSAFHKVGALRAFQTLFPPDPQALTPQIQERYRQTGGVSGLF